MRINFFEEFPEEKNLKKIKLIDFPSTIFIASKSLSDFNKFSKELKKINPKLETAYWPIIPNSYWLSPFSNTKDIQNLIKDLQGNKSKKPLKILLDLELPVLNKKLFLKNAIYFLRNKSLIKFIFNKQKSLNLEIFTAENSSLDEKHQKKLEIQGVSYSISVFSHKKITMFYSSMCHPSTIEKRKEMIKQKSKKHQNNFQVGLGTIATGILGNEPILSPRELDKDLYFLKKQNIGTAVIFRLGGLKKDYLEIIKKYT